ncbi:MAG: XRE family transcriptional regulator, partial [Chitinophagaceae bacterium]
MKRNAPSAFAFMRIELGLTQQQLADDCGISREAVAMAERGHRPMPQRAADYLRQMAALTKQMPLPAQVYRRKRASVASVRAPYNRV